MTYDAESVRQYFDRFADREWERLERTVQGRANYAIHRRLLERYARPGLRVLDIGSGPGRYAVDLVRLGCDVTVADLSPVQLDLARQRLAAEGLAARVADVRELDVVDMRPLGDESFDLVVCLGGVLSYARERHGAALAELARVARRGGVVLVSVMSLFGTLRLAGPLDAAGFLEQIDAHLDVRALRAGDRVVYTRVGSTEFHQPLALFSSDGLRSAMSDAGLVVEAMASAGPLLDQFLPAARIAASDAATRTFRELELLACEEPGLLDAGGHLIAAARRPPAT